MKIDLDLAAYRKALALAGFERDHVQACDRTATGWLIQLITRPGVRIFLTPDGRWSS